MAVYFEKQINFDVPSSIHTDIEWHNLFPVLSVASYNDDRGGFVSLYTDEGIKVNANFPSHLNSQISCVSWHPGRKILAIALENGDLLTWNDHDDDVFQPDIQHKGPICAIQWSTLGSRLVSTDGSGGMICWKADTRGQLKMVFHHELKDPLTEVVFRTVSQPKQAVDISGLARAAVSGDEQALDLFSSWPAKTSISRITLGNEKKENLNFFVGSTTGVVYYMNENGSCTDVIHLDGGIKQLLYHENHDLLVVITDGLILSQYQVDEDGSVTEMTKVKLMGRSMEANVIWAGRGILAVTTGENLIRIWDLDMGDNYVLTLEGSHFHDTAEVITCIDFNESKGILAGGTNRGNIALWRYLGDNSAAIRKDSEKSWKLQSPSNVQGAIKHIKWGSSLGLLAVNTVRDLYILNEHIMSFHFKDQVSAVQISPSQLVIDLFANKQQTQLKTDLQIHGVYVMVDHIAVWNRKKVAIYEISENGRLIASGCFSANTNVVALLEHSVYTFEDGKVQVRTFQGTVKQSLAFLEDEGQPLCMDICGTFLVVGTTEGFIKIWDISRREAKLQANPKSLSQVIPNFGHIVSAKCNCTGTKVSIISTLVSNSPNYKLYIWDLETDIIQYFNFSSGKPEQDDDEETSSLNKETDLSASERARSEIAHEVAGHYPISHFWDPEENHQLVCEAALLPVDLQNGEKPIFSDEVKNQDILVVSLLVMPESGILVQETFYLENSYSTLLGIHIPYYYLLKKLDDCDSSRKSPTLNNKQDKNHQSKLSGYVIQKTIRDFVGLEESDKATRQAMMSFSYYLTIGNMDEAFKAIKSIKSGSVWENMAKMCVKTKRLDVASVCLGNMGHGRGARALREAMKEPELDAQVAMLAVQLGLNEEAEKLYRSCGRYDLLNQFYQGCGLWKKALEIAESHDRIHLRTTFYNYAKHLESAGDITMAIQSYEKSDTHRFEVPRMLFDEPQALEEYISRSKDKVLQKWWAQYMESTGEMETALFCYELAQDYLSLVRVYCYCNNLEKAAEIANETGDKAACYHLGRQFENREDIKEAIHFYTRAQAYSNAIRLCKEQNMEEQLLNLALMGNEQEMIDVASYYENKQGHEEKAIMLYHKGGMFGKAVDLAFRTRQYSALHQIANDLNECTDPQLLQRCAQFFVENSQFDKAVDLLAVGKKYIEALDLCVEHSLPITEELAEKLTPPKNETENGLRIRILEKVAESCYQQDNYHLATKKFTQAGNKIKAMKALLKSGDTDKIVFFANVSRQKEIYIMAANYLQSLNWRKDPDIMKNIIGFYSKGRALDLLAGFYDACAQVEIDEFQNYEKAFEALNEASKCLSKAKTHPHYEQKMAQLQMKLELVKKFVHIRRMYEDDPTEAMRLCQNLLSDPDLETGIRKGDVYGFMVEHYSRIKNHKAAYNLIEEMRSKMPNTNIAFYVNMKTIETIYQSLDIPLNKSPFDKNQAILRQGPSGDDDVEEEVEEVVSTDMLGRKELLKSESLQL